MKIVLIGCQFNYSGWDADVTALSLEHASIKAQDALAEEILNRPDKTTVLYSMNTMEFDFETLLSKIKGAAELIPIGGDAASLGLESSSPEHISIANKYVLYGGDKNISELGKYLIFNFGGGHVAPEPPMEMPFHGIFRFDSSIVYDSLETYIEAEKPKFDRFAAVLTHRHSWVNNGLDAVKAVCEALEGCGVGAIPVFSSNDAYSPSFPQIAERYFKLSGVLAIDALVSFSLFGIKASDGRSASEQSVEEYKSLGVPVFAPVHSYYMSESAWLASNNPLTLDMPTAFITPESSGMIEPILISTAGKGGKPVPIQAQVELCARRIASWVRLRRAPNSNKRVALILHNSVCSGVEATIGKAFGMDALESVVRILKRLACEGYDIENAPENGSELLGTIMGRKAFSDFRWTSVEDILKAGGSIYEMSAESEYQNYFSSLPKKSQEQMLEVWGEPPGEGMALDGNIIITGVEFGNALVMVQPKRGCYGAKCTGEVCKILHDPSCPPPHQYLAAYRYLRDIFKADAVIDVGTDGSCEYLPGKASGLSPECWPSIALDSLPSVYLYHAGVISEAMLAKRRMNSVIVDYLPPASMGADDKSASLSRLIDDYRSSELLGNGQAPIIEKQIALMIEDNPAAKRIAGEDPMSSLSEIQEAIRNIASARQLSIEPHIFGQNPSEEEARRFALEALDPESELDFSALIEAEEYLEIEKALKKTEQEMDSLIAALSGKYIPAGESGMPDENGQNIIPTGRNMFGMQIDRVPTMAAWERGVELAEQLIDQYKSDEGRLPEQIAMNMISIDVTRAKGEQLSEFLYLLGISPVWDKQGRVCGLKEIPLETLGRPRIDVTVRISGVLRDTWPSIASMMDEAVLMAEALDEPESGNFLLKHMREYRSEYGQGERAVRIFGDPPGAYGAGIDLALLASAWKSEEDLAMYFAQSSAFAYGKGLDGEKKTREFIDTARRVEATTDITESRRMNAMSCGFGVQVQGGFRLLAKRLSGRAIRQYQAVSEAGRAPITESLSENLKKAVEGTLLNEFWRESAMARGYDGASDIMHGLQNVFSAQAVNESFDDAMLDRIADETINNEGMREWLGKTNPYALEEIARRLLELESRGKWVPGSDVLESLKQNYLMIEGDMEGMIEPTGEIQGGNVDIVNHESVGLWASSLTDIEAEMRNASNKGQEKVI